MIPQSAVSLQEVLGGLEPTDGRLYGEIIGLLEMDPAA